MKIAYIAGPYRAKTYEEKLANIERAKQYALKYIKQGYCVILPHTNFAWLDGQVDESKILEMCLELICIMRKGDVLVAIPGWPLSDGSMREIVEATNRETEIIYEQEENK